MARKTMPLRYSVENANRTFCTVAACVLLFAIPAAAADETNISGTFDGCEFDKTYELLDGRSLECRTYHYHYAYAPKVIVIDGSTVLIDGEEYAAWVR